MHWSMVHLCAKCNTCKNTSFSFLKNIPYYLVRTMYNLISKVQYVYTCLFLFFFVQFLFLPLLPLQCHHTINWHRHLDSSIDYYHIHSKVLQILSLKSMYLSGVPHLHSRFKSRQSMSLNSNWHKRAIYVYPEPNQGELK